jgi:ABC-2 type transport system ATP-binding protein
MAAISISGLVKRFGRTTALDGLDLTVGEGEVHGFLGPNGSGKTTTIRILLGLLRSDAGTVRLLGGDPWKDAVALHGRLAYVPGDVTLWPGITGGEVIDLLGRLRGGAGGSGRGRSGPDPSGPDLSGRDLSRRHRARRDELLERFDLDPSKKARAYSKGNRQKVALVAALASDAELLLLDEPTSGLDPLMEAEFQRCVRQARHEGRTILLSSHILAEVEALCDRVSIVRLGRTVESGTLAELRHLTRTAISVETVRPITGLSGVHDAVVDDRHARFDVDDTNLEPVMRQLAALGVRSLTSTPPTLEEMFLRHYGPGDGGAPGDGSGAAGGMAPDDGRGAAEGDRAGNGDGR